MMAYRLRMKVGQAEFEAEGDEESVLREYAEWKEFLKQLPAGNGNGSGSALPVAGTPQLATPRDASALSSDDLRRVFDYDERRNLVTLKFLPGGEDRNSTAMLLVLLGYKRLAGTDDVPVTLLKSALVQTGIGIDRIDRDAAPDLLRDQLVLKGGKAKGGHYKLTNTGVIRAEDEARKLLTQI